jgi:hypothetical protein
MEIRELAHQQEIYLYWINSYAHKHRHSKKKTNDPAPKIPLPVPVLDSDINKEILNKASLSTPVSSHQRAPTAPFWL